METNFTFSCRDWKDDGDDPDALLFYKVFYSGDDQQKYLLYHGPKSTVFDLKLPAAKYNYFNLSINVEDAFKAYSSNRSAVYVSNSLRGSFWYMSFITKKILK